MTHADFLSSFLKKRNLDLPDGRPLYEYKISNGRYQALKVLLSDRWDNMTECHAGFVLYAVEFLRAESSEGHLRWDYIFNSIGRGDLNNPQTRTRIVQNGLQYWGRAIFQGQNREFLETLRFESGLPNSSLNDNNNLSSLIKVTFQLVESFKLTEEELIPHIEERIEKYPIPQVLRQVNFYSLLAKLCFKFLEFKERFDLANQPNPTEYLKSQLTDWRSEMPLKIEGDRMNDFFNRIISDISRLNKIEPLALTLDTTLTEVNSEFLLKTLVSIPKGIFVHDAIGLNEEEFNNLPGYFCLNFESGGKVKFLTSFNKLNNGKISSRGLAETALPDEVFDNEWLLTFSSENMEIRVETELSKFFKIRLQDPLVFIEERTGKWIYKGSAPVKLKVSTCRILLDSTLYSFENAAKIVGESIKGLSVYHLESNSLINDVENQSSFWVKLAQDNESYKVLDFISRGLPESGSFDFLKENEHIYLGFPKVFLFNKQLGLKEIFSGLIEVFGQDNTWQVLESSVVGRKKFRFKDKIGDILGVKTLNVFPIDFKIYLNDKTKVVEFYSESNFKVLLSRNGLITEVVSNGNKVELIIDPTVDDVSNTKITIGVCFDFSGIIELKIPNPNFAEVFVNGDGKVVERASYSLSKIHGLGIINNNYNGISEKKLYTIKLEDIHNREASALKIKKEIRIDAFSSKRQAVYQWTQVINQLFSLTSNTRAKVKIASDKPHHYLEISKYDLELNFDASTGLLSNDLPEGNINLKLSAFRLDQTFSSSKVIDLNIITNEFNIIEFIPTDGIWFLFSKECSHNSITPKVIIKGDKKINEDEAPIQQLWEGSFFDYEKRISRFKEFFDAKYLQFDDPVWKELYELFKATEHLPISALDVWKGLVKSPKAMLTFLFSSFAELALIQKVSLELGFIWHLVSLYRWQEAFGTWSDYLEKSEEYNQIANIFKSAKLELIKNELGLDSLVELLNQTPDVMTSQQLAYFVNLDINGETGRLGLRGRHPDGVFWASYAKEFIVDKIKDLPNELKNIVPNGLYGWQKPVIYLPLVLAYHSNNSRFINVHELRPEILLGIKLNMDFDKAYFDDVYSKVQGFFFSQSCSQAN
ncbi:STY4851/ECs_5259 family protein [Algoriphagus persicinus]|uniref:STY4851/ECs_5259 family protein n=1 Tax=Algoriphagus persicinus TaxID=3108754 RepID=UPI002B363F00|nr:STY4851/ECs_5259 family protein [Algoriphagus sp. E1-3-M2]MEB2786516.1 STY4851/ECs_5259 family protein [Algoriphagus sp. E1-3-M2]